MCLHPHTGQIGIFVCGTYLAITCKMEFAVGCVLVYINIRYIYICIYLCINVRSILTYSILDV